MRSADDQSTGHAGRGARRVRVGVTGHRVIGEEQRVRDEVRRALDEIRDTGSGQGRTSVRFDVVSPLAEGADRLVADELLRERGARLIVPLPFAEEEYVRDFESGQSKARFRELLRRAAEVVTLSATTSRDEAYARVGRYVVEHCDVLLALWDGRPTKGPGGTAETVAYAAQRGVPVVWIPTERDSTAELDGETAGRA